MAHPRILRVAAALAALSVTASAFAQNPPPKKKKKPAATAPAKGGAGAPAAGVSAGASVSAPSASVSVTAPKAEVTTTAPKAEITTTAPKAEVTATAPAGEVVATETAPAGAVAPSERADRAGFAIAGLLGFESSGYGFGLGARAGYTLPFPHLYFGGELGYNFGSNGVHVFHFQPEVGYDIALPVPVPILIRPYLGFGVAAASAGGVTQSAFVFSPSVLSYYDITPNVFAGLDMRLPIYSAGGSTVNFGMSLTGGYKF